MRQKTHSFIIRIWYEAVDEQNQALVWRGSIEHVNSGNRLHFDEIEEFVDFIKDESGLADIEPAPWWRSIFAWIKL